MKKYVILLLFLLLISVVVAHQPRITSSEDIIVKEPEVSKAYYGNLEGNPHVYVINSDENFNLYVNILVPNIEGIDKDFSVIIKKDGIEVGFLDGINYEWIEFYEKFAGDSYWAGPEFDEKVSLGRYEIIVTSPDNRGKYSLAIGKIESFPFLEIVNAIIILPSLKKDFFEKSPLTAYLNLSGLFLFLVLIIIIFILFKVFKKES